MALVYRAPETYRTAFTYQGQEGGSAVTPYQQLQGVLNQLAGTTANPRATDGAANVWCGTTANPRALLGALNAKNGSYGLGFNAVCNSLAGTSGLSGVAALNALAGNGPP